jgi:hypothetical protein
VRIFVRIRDANICQLDIQILQNIISTLTKFNKSDAIFGIIFIIIKELRECRIDSLDQLNEVCHECYKTKGNIEK